MRTPTRAFRRRRTLGLSLLDTAMSLSMLAAVSGIVVPAAAGMMDRARVARAQMEVNAIATALMGYYRDIGKYPGGEKVHYHQQTERLVLASDGTLPEAGSSLAMRQWVQSPRASLYRFLRTSDDYAGDRWRGPYLPNNISEDPWGQAYMVNISCAITSATSGERKRAVFVLSAGPNGVVNTPFHQFASRAETLGDDIAIRIQ